MPLCLQLPEVDLLGEESRPQWQCGHWAAQSDLRTLLLTLHLALPQFPPVSEEQLASPDGVNEAYKQALALSHPDKLPVAMRTIETCSQATLLYDPNSI